MRLDLSFILNSLSQEDAWNPGDCKSFFFEDWSLSLIREEDQYKPFTFSVSGSKQNTNETISRRYTSMENAFLHILNHFNENANVKNRFKSLFDIIEGFPEQRRLEAMKAVDIEWDVDSEEDRDLLPSEIDIPEGMKNEDDISDYLSGVTGFCHKGFRLIDCSKDATIDKCTEPVKASLSEQIQSASTRAVMAQPTSQVKTKKPEPEI